MSQVECHDTSVPVWWDEKSQREISLDAFYLQVDATKRGGIARFINHSCEVTFAKGYKYVALSH